MRVPIPHYGCYIVAQVLTVTLCCPNCRDEIDFVAQFQAYTEIPKFRSVSRCPACAQYFIDDDGAGYSVEPYSYRTVLEWRAIAEAMVCRVPTREEIRECRMEEERKVVHLPSNMRASEKFGKKRKKEKRAIVPMGKNVFDTPV